MKPYVYRDRINTPLLIETLHRDPGHAYVMTGHSGGAIELPASEVPAAAMALFEAAGLDVPDLLRQAVAPEDHVAAARQGLESAAYSYQEWGRSEDTGYLAAAGHALGSSVVHGLLAIAEAIEKSGGAA